MKFAKRIEHLPPYLFVGISQKIAAKKAKGPKKLVPKMPGEMSAKAARGLAAMGKK